MLRNTRKQFSGAVLLFLCVTSLHAEYVEGTGTTDNEGYGLNGTFQIDGGDWGYYITGMVVAHYCFDPHWCRGYYNYSFEEITMAPDTIRHEYENIDCECSPYYCFVVRDTNSNIYSKVEILTHLDGHRFEYRFGTNTTPGDRILTDEPGNLSVVHNVNNLYYTGHPYFMHGDDPEHKKYYSRTLSWDPPLDTVHNRPVRYILYRSKEGITIDTTAPVDQAQWDSITVQNSPEVVEDFPDIGYFNFVVVYINGQRSDFLSGWSRCNYDIVGVIKNAVTPQCGSDKITVEKSAEGLFISLPQRNGGSGFSSIDLFSLTGRRVATLSAAENATSLTAFQPEIGTGSYILRAVLKEGGSIALPFMLTK
jgi:hypothetical protein